MEVLVFKTNIRYKKEVASLQASMAAQPGILKWNVDLWDCDKVLRVESKNIPPLQIENMVQHLGYVCEELK